MERNIAPLSPRPSNGWSKEQEKLMAEWSDIASCYKWIHDKSEKIYHTRYAWINLPVIMLTTLGGTASFGLSTMFSTDAGKQYASFTIGSISLCAGILTTLGSYLRIPQLEEAHRVASVSWGKFQRLIAVELGLHPGSRMEAMDFLKMCRSELDRLMEQAPPIPDAAIALFEEKFGHIKNIKKPDVCGLIEPTSVFETAENKLKRLAEEAELTMKNKNDILNELSSPELHDTIQKGIEMRMNEIMENHKKQEDESADLESVNLLPDAIQRQDSARSNSRLSLKNKFELLNMLHNPLLKSYVSSPPASARSMSREPSMAINMETPITPRPQNPEQNV